ncbi:Zinc finger MYM-type protein 1 [Eumeta japonica]|uniref:Zinc finger MYM-type protein 1 n=1 Tax=Eumeta variegata TaxID=151549 RepID=A0A4C1X1G2_EUMVA|nr:Zinc finger MYM-type protein 1 [Eumeta japonica]
MATPRAREPAGRKPRASGERELHNSNSVFSGLSSDIQNDLIKSIAQVIRDEIKSEINFAKFVSVIADETPDISHREQISVIFRYLTKTGIEERFVGFFDVTLERGADQLLQSILEVIDQFNCKEKLVGQSYDGAAVMSALKRIHTYLRNSQTEQRLSDLALLSIEKHLLLQIKSKPNFYDLVLAHFLKKIVDYH